jgi:hypothetical protein
MYRENGHRLLLWWRVLGLGDGLSCGVAPGSLPGVTSFSGRCIGTRRGHTAPFWIGLQECRRSGVTVSKCSGSITGCLPGD